MTNIDIHVISDTVCPWCYVGYKRLDKAINAFRAFIPTSSPVPTFSITWHPFYLNPDSPIKGAPLREYLEQHFGPGRFDLIQQRLATIGQQEGINFKFGGKTGNTRLSHRLVQLGKLHDGSRNNNNNGKTMQTRLMENLFSTYFENEQDITSKNVLVRAGVDAGLVETEVREWLDGEGGGPDVDREVAEARGRFVTGVPHYTINGKYEVEGAQDTAAFLEIFNKIAASSDASGGTTAIPTGDSC